MNVSEKLLYLLILLNIAQNIDAFWGRSFFHPRSQNTNVVRQAVGQHNLRHRHDYDTVNGTFSVIPQYSQSFKPFRIAQYLFGCDCLSFSGSMVTTSTSARCPNRPGCHILADYFGLSPKFEGRVTFKPEIKTFLADFDLFIDLTRGAYFEINAPLVTTRWNICLAQEVFNNGIKDPFPAGYMADGIVQPPITSLCKALGGDISFGDVKQGIQFGKIGCCCRETKIADVNMVLGWIVVNRENGYAGLNLRVTAPTGTRATSYCLFEPIIGNGHHWEIGVGFVGQSLIWEKDANQTLHFHVDANFTHLMYAEQRRSFDFACNGFLSRYMLLKAFDSHGNYTGTCLPAINVTSLCCKVKIDFQADINLMFAYNKDNFEFDFGYNGWIRSREKICLIDSIPRERYGIKGIQNVSGTDANKTESQATICGEQFQCQEEVADRISPQYIKTSDLCVESAESPKSITHKLYFNVSRAWGKVEDKKYIPYLGVGGDIEFESINPRWELPYKNTLYQWALWLKGGFAYG